MAWDKTRVNTSTLLLNRGSLERFMLSQRQGEQLGERSVLRKPTFMLDYDPYLTLGNSGVVRNSGPWQPVGIDTVSLILSTLLSFRSSELHAISV